MPRQQQAAVRGAGLGRAGMPRGTKVVALALALVITHEARQAWRPLRRVFGLCRASVCDSGLKRRFQSECGSVVMLGVPGAYARGSAETGPSGLVWVFGGCRDQVLTHLALLRSALQAFGGPLRRVLSSCRACACGSGLKGCFPVFQGRSPANAPFCCADGSPEHAAPRPEVGQRPRTT
jgi:hypothetical protein